MYPGRRSPGAQGDLHPLGPGAEAGVSGGPEIPGAQGLSDGGRVGLRHQPSLSAACPGRPDARTPEFRDCAKHPEAAPDGFVLYYTDQCPYTSYWVPRVQETAREHGIPLRVIHITSREEAQRVPAPVTTYALFRDGRFLTLGIQSDKKFLALAGGKADGV